MKNVTRRSAPRPALAATGGATLLVACGAQSSGNQRATHPVAHLLPLGI